MNETEERMPKHNHRTELFFIELLRMYAGTATHLSETPTDEEWQGIYELAQKHAVNGLLYRVLERHADKVRPPRQVLFNLYAQASRIKQRNKLRDALPSHGAGNRGLQMGRRQHLQQGRPHFHLHAYARQC